MPQVKYVGPFDEVEVLGRVVRRGESAEFDAALVGRAPKGEPLTDDGEPNPDYDPGEGLLSQVDIFQSAAKKGDAK